MQTVVVGGFLNFCKEFFKAGKGYGLQVYLRDTPVELLLILSGRPINACVRWENVEYWRYYFYILNVTDIFINRTFWLWKVVNVRFLCWISKQCVVKISILMFCGIYNTKRSYVKIVFIAFLFKINWFSFCECHYSQLSQTFKMRDHSIGATIYKSIIPLNHCKTSFIRLKAPCLRQLLSVWAF